MKLISINKNWGTHTTVMVFFNNIEYYVSRDNYGNENETFDNSNPRKIRKDSKLHKKLVKFAEDKIAQAYEASAPTQPTNQGQQ
jgi:hypothetical protein